MYLHELRTILESILAESLETVIRDNQDIPESVIRHYHANALDDNNKSDRALNFVLKLHRKGQVIPDTAKDLKPHMTAISRANLFPKLKEVDTLDKLHSLTEPHANNITTKREKLDADSPVVFENDHIKITQHKTHESAVKGARLHPANPMADECREPGKAQWCVSVGGSDGLGHFNKYTENGKHPMYTIFNKHTKRTHALVANPHDILSEQELRTEKDEGIQNTSTLSHFINGHPGIEKSVVGEHLFKMSPINRDIHIRLPADASPDTIRKIHAGESVSHIKNAALSHPNAPHDLLADHIDNPHTSINPNLPKDLLDKALKHPDEKVRESAVSHQKLTPEQIDSLHNEKNYEVRYKGIMNNHLSNDQIGAFLLDDNAVVRYSAMMKPNTSKEQLSDVLRNDEHHMIRSNALNHRNSDSSHVSLALRDKEVEVAKMAALSNKASSENIHNALNHSNENVRIAALSNPNIKDEHFEKALKDGDSLVRSEAAYRTKNPTHIEKALHDSYHNVRGMAIRNPNVTSHHIDIALKDEYPINRRQTANLPTLQPHHIDTALKDDDIATRSYAIQSANASPHNLKTAMNDSYYGVRRGAVINKNATPEIIGLGLADKHNDVRYTAILHPNATKEQIESAMSSDDYGLRKNVMERDDIGDDMLMRGLSDDSLTVGQSAVENPNIKKRHLDYVVSDDYVHKNVGFVNPVIAAAKRRLYKKDYKQ